MINADTSWSLFLDRDGVLNRRLPGAYVRQWEEFEWLPGVLECIGPLTHAFGRAFVVTNQQGIGKGLMTEAQLQQVHRKMLAGIEGAGGRLDAVYHCPALSGVGDNCRKPAPAMGLQAKREFPEIRFSRAVMVGDSLSDMQFGQALGMYCVWIRGKEEEEEAIHLALNSGLRIQGRFSSLAEFADSLGL